MPDLERVAVVGASGAGKSTFARALARKLEADWVEFDAIHHLPGWTRRPVDEMRAIVDARCPADGRWVTDGNYTKKGGTLVRERADAIVWLDLPRRVVMFRIVRRTLGRLLSRRPLWNGNRETPRTALFMLRWAWVLHGRQDAMWAVRPDPRLVRLRTQAEIDAFLSR